MLLSKSNGNLTVPYKRTCLQPGYSTYFSFKLHYLYALADVPRLVEFPVRAHTKVAGSVSGPGAYNPQFEGRWEATN